MLGKWSLWLLNCLWKWTIQCHSGDCTHSSIQCAYLYTATLIASEESNYYYYLLIIDLFTSRELLIYTKVIINKRRSRQLGKGARGLGKMRSCPKFGLRIMPRKHILILDLQILSLFWVYCFAEWISINFSIERLHFWAQCAFSSTCISSWQTSSLSHLKINTVGWLSKLKDSVFSRKGSCLCEERTGKYS